MSGDIDVLDGSEHDVVVIGGGMAGLSAAAFLADAGRDVLVVEQADTVGGLLAELPVPGFHVSTAVHNLGGANEVGRDGAGILAAAAQQLGLDGYELLPLDAVFSIETPDAGVIVPTDHDGWVDAFAAVAPSRRAALRDLIELCDDVADQLRRFPIVPSIRTYLRMPREFPGLLRYRSATAAEIVGGHLADDRLTALVTSLCIPYLGLPPEQASFLIWAYMTSMYATSAHVVRGGPRALANAFVRAIEDRDGRVVVNTEVTRIDIVGGRVTGVAGAGWQVRCGAVVVACDPRQLVHMVEINLPQRYVRDLFDAALPYNFVATYFRSDVDLHGVPVTYETFVGDDPRLRSVWGLHVPTLVDPTCAPPAEHVVVLFERGSSTNVAPSEVANVLRRRAEEHVPELEGRLTPLDGSTAPVVRVFPTPYGYAFTPSQVGLGRTAHTTPVDGLYLAGQWTRPGASIPAVVSSGAEVSRIMTDDRVDEPLLPL